MNTVIRYSHLRNETSKNRERLCYRFYNEIYCDAFPIAKHAEDPDIWLPLMKDHVPAGLPVLHMILACDQTEQILGGVIFELYRATNCWLITYIAVHPDHRGRGIASGLMATLVSCIG